MTTRSIMHYLPGAESFSYPAQSSQPTRSRVRPLPGAKPTRRRSPGYLEQSPMATRAEYATHLEQNTLLTRSKVTSYPPAYPEQKPAATWQNARPPTWSKIHYLPGAKSLATRLPTRSKNQQLPGKMHGHLPGAKTSSYLAQNTQPPTRSKKHYLPAAKIISPMARPPNWHKIRHLPGAKHSTRPMARPPTRRKIHHLPGAKSQATQRRIHHLPGVKSLPPNMALRCRNEQFYYSCSRKKVGT